MENITSQLKDMISSQLSGNPDARSNALKGLRDVKENNEEGNKRNSPQDYLKDSNGLKLVFELAKQKRTNKATIRKEIKKLLKNPEEINDFLNSILSFVKSKKGSDKDETKEATGSGSAGVYSAPLFGKEMKETKEEYCDSCDRVKSKCVCNRPRRTETKEATGSASSGQYSGPSIWAKSTKKKDWAPKRKTQLPGGKFVQVKKKCKKFPYCNQGDINAIKMFENETLSKVINDLSIRYQIHEDFIRGIIFNEMSKRNLM
jgi:hypothetical protein